MPKITHEHGSTSGGSLRTVSLVGLAVAAVGILAGAFVAGPILIPAGILAIVFFGIHLISRARRDEGSLVVSRSSDSTPKGTRTSSDDQNVWMRAINTKLGFLPGETETIIQKNRSAD